MEDQSPASMGPLHMERFSLVLWAMPSIKIIITLCTFSCHLHWIWSRKRFCAKCLAQHLLSPVQQRSHLPVPTLEILGDNSFIHLAQQWCPPEMCKYAWTTMLGVYKLMINVKWMYGWGYIYMKPRKSSQPPDRQCNQKAKITHVEKCVAIIFIQSLFFIENNSYFP